LCKWKSYTVILQGWGSSDVHSVQNDGTSHSMPSVIFVEVIAVLVEVVFKVFVVSNGVVEVSVDEVSFMIVN